MKAYYAKRRDYPIQLDTEQDFGDGDVVFAISIFDAEKLIDELKKSVIEARK